MITSHLNNEHKKIPGHMTLEIQALFWERHQLYFGFDFSPCKADKFPFTNQFIICGFHNISTFNIDIIQNLHIMNMQNRVARRIWRYQRGKSESVYRRRTDNTMVKARLSPVSQPHRVNFKFTIVYVREYTFWKFVIFPMSVVGYLPLTKIIRHIYI